MIERISVVQLFYTFDVEVGGGGLSRFAIELGKHLDPKLFDVSLVSLGYYSSPLGKIRINELNSGGIKAYEATNWQENAPYDSFIKSVLALRKLYIQTPVDILHSHSEYTDVVAILLKSMGVTHHILRTVHYGYQYEWSTKPVRRALLTNFLYPILFNQEIGINQFNTNRLNRRWIARLLKRRAQRVYNAIPLDQFKSTMVDSNYKKETLGIPPNAIVVGTVGRLAEQKGYTYLVDAVPIILEKFPQAYFLIIGDGPLAENLKFQANSLGVSSRITFTGGRTDVEELLKCMDVFVSSSLWEGLPTVILESMACGVPVVATDIEGTRELITNGQNGILSEARSGVALASGILTILENKTMSKELSAYAQKTVERFSIDKIAKEYETLYENLLDKSNSTA